MDAESRGWQSGWVEATAEVIPGVTMEEDTRVEVPAGTRVPRLPSTPATWQPKTDDTEIDIDGVEEEVGDIFQSKATEYSVTTTTREAQITTTPTFITITTTATTTSKRQPELTEVNFSDWIITYCCILSFQVEEGSGAGSGYEDDTEEEEEEEEEESFSWYG